jgi:hypothetical protein
MDDSGLKLLAAVEALHAELRVVHAKLNEERSARDALASVKASAAARQSKYREALRHNDVTPTCGSNVTSRHGDVTPQVVKALDLEALKQEQLLKDRSVTSQSRHVTSPTTPVWNAYSEAYEARYGAKPVRNAKVNGQLKQLIERLGADAGPVAAFYVSHPKAWYATNGHNIGLLLASCETLHTEWKTGNVITDAAVRQQERTAANGQVFNSLLKGKEHVG